MTADRSAGEITKARRRPRGAVRDGLIAAGLELARADLDRARARPPNRPWHDGAARGSAGRAGLRNQAELAGPGDGLGAVGRAELAEDVADVLFDRVEADHQLCGDARVRRARG